MFKKILLSLKGIIIKRKMLSLCIAGAILFIAILSARTHTPDISTSPEILKVLPEVLKTTPEGARKTMEGMMQNPEESKRLLQGLADQLAPKQGIKILEATPLFFKLFNGEFYGGIGFALATDKGPKKMGFVLTFKNFQNPAFTVLTEEDFNHFLTSGGDAQYLKKGFGMTMAEVVQIQKNNAAAQATPAQTPEATPEPNGSVAWSDWAHYKRYSTQWYGTYRVKKGTSNLGNGNYKHYLRVELENTNAWVRFSNLSCNGQVILSIIGLPAGCDLGGGGFADQSGTTFEAEDTLDDCNWDWNAFFKAD